MKWLTFLNEKIEERILVASLLLTVLLVLAQTIARYVIDYQMGWSQELARYLVIWIAWISASYVVHKNAHIRVELLKDQLSARWKKFLEFIVLIVSFVFALFLAIAGTRFVIMIGQTSQVSPSLGVPMWIVYLAVPVAGILMSIRFVQQTLLIYRQ